MERKEYRELSLNFGQTLFCVFFDVGKVHSLFGFRKLEHLPSSPASEYTFKGDSTVRKEGESMAGRKNVIKVNNNAETHQVCLKCQKKKSLKSDYYATNSALYPNGNYPVCKACILEKLPQEKDPLDKIYLKAVHNILLELNKPFLHNLWLSSIDEGKRRKWNTFNCYMKNVQFNHKDLTWNDSIFSNKEADPSRFDNVPPLSNTNSEFVVTENIIEKWGEGYSPEEYRLFEKKWKKLIDNYGEKTSLHTEGLITYIRFRVKEELATARGLTKEAKEWGTLASAAAKDAKLNVSQLSKSDISGGVDLMPQLFEAVESEVGIIPVLPHLKEQPYDDADLIIWCIVNYLRRLEEKPRVAYKDIWNFYDTMLEEFFLQKGYSNEQISKEKQKRNNVFRDLGEVYIEPLYSEGD